MEMRLGTYFTLSTFTEMMTVEEGFTNLQVELSAL